MIARAGFVLGVLVIGCAPHGPAAGGEESSVVVDALHVIGGAEGEPDAELDVEVADGEDVPSDACERLAERREPIPVDPAADNGGLLLTTKDGAIVGLPLADTTFRTAVTGTIASTTVVQTFVNDFDAPIEAVYTFPLPHDGAVDRYAFRFAGHEVRGVLKKRSDAVKEYEKAKDAGQTAGLLEQERPNVFSQRIANLPPGASIEVEIHVVQPLTPTRGRYELALPTVVAPRYVEGVADAGRISPPILPPGRRTCGDLHVEVAFDPGLPVGRVRSEAHRILTSTADGTTRVELDERFALLDRDFVLSWERGDARPRAMMLTEEKDGQTYFALTIEPPAIVPLDHVPAREIVFVLDASGSMQGEPMDAAKAAMRELLDGLRPGDAFQVVRFSDKASGLGEALLPATPENHTRALDYIQGLEAEGGTVMTDGIRAAFAFPRDEDRIRFVVFLTDGFIGDEAEVFALVDETVGDARLFSLGIGSSVNRYLLDGMARVGRGDVAYLNLEEDPVPLVERMWQQLDRPAVVDIALDFGKTKVDELVPARVPDLLVDRPVVVFGRLHGPPKGEILVRGRRGDEAMTLRVPVRKVVQRETTGLASSWARQRIAELMLDPAYLRGRGPATRRIESEVLDLSLRHDVLTELTAFVAVDRRASITGRGASTTVIQGVDLAEGMAHEYVFGELAAEGGRDGGSGTGSGYGGGSGHGFGGRGSRAPRVRMSQAQMVHGGLDKHIIRRIVRAHLQEIRGCYNKALVRDPTAAGRIVVQFTIGGDGRVGAAVIVSSDIEDTRLGRCIAAKVRGWEFPTGPDAGHAIVSYPFVLQPSNTTGTPPEGATVMPRNTPRGGSPGAARNRP
jgi:Ca-activated chloride channel homolog